MIAIDTNILVYAHRADMPLHEPARDCVEALAAGPERFGIPWPCVHEFIAVVTRPGVFRTPSSMAVALSVCEAFDALPRCDFLAEGAAHLPRLRELATTGHIVGAAIHDARIAAICQQHGIHELWSADRDFSRFPALKVRNPLLG